jgi:hypothetical protein
MPHRDESDRAIYGIDPAWIHEVLSTWRGIAPEETEMPEGPSAEFTNRIRSIAASIKSGSSSLLKSAPTTNFSNLSQMLSANAAQFGDVPPDVAVGDLVRREDVADMFAWMEDVRWRYVGNGTETRGADVYDTEMGGYAKYPDEYDYHDDLPIFTPTNIYRWSWSYVDYTGGAFEHLTGGVWQRSSRRAQTATVTLAGRKASIFSSAVSFAQFTAYDIGAQALASQYLLLDSSLSANGDGDCVVKATIPSGVAVRNTLGLTDPPFEHETGSVNRYITVGNIGCVLEYSADYRV